MNKGIVKKTVACMLAITTIGCTTKEKTKVTKADTNAKTTTTTKKAAKTTESVPKDVYVKVSAAGDCTLAKTQNSSYAGSFLQKYDQKGPKYFFSNVKSTFAKDDLTLVNFEGTLTYSNNRMVKAFNFKAPPKYLKILQYGGVDAVAFANNHCKDYGQQSYNDTIKTFKKYKMPYSSFGSVGVYKTKGMKIGMVAVDFNAGMSFGQMKDARRLVASGCKKLKAKKVNAIIVSMHGGVEGSHSVRGDQISLGHYAVDQGADLVIGTHPHVLEGIERYKGAYIAYSLGNFCFGGNHNPRDKDTAILQKTLHFKNGKLVRDQQLKIIPCSISSVSYTNDYKPTIVSGARRTRIINNMNSYSRRFKVSFNSAGNAK